MLISSASAQNWDGDVDSNWNNQNNWQGNVFPTAPTDAIVNKDSATPPFFPIITANSAFTPRDIRVGNTSAGTEDGRVDHRAGLLQTGVGNWMFVGIDGNTGTYNLADTSGGGGVLTGFATGSGSLNVGNSSTTSGRLIVGNSSSVGTVNMNTSGTMKIEQDNNALILGDGGTSTGNFNLDAGTLNVNASLAGNGLAVLIGTNGGDGNFRMSGGDVNVTGRVWLGDNNANSFGLLHMTGGTFDANGVEIGRAGGHGTVTINGGTLTTADLFIGRGTNPGSTGTGNVTVGSGATLTVTNELAVGYAGNGAGGAQGTMDVAGTVKVTGAGAQKVLNIGVFDSVHATLNINPGADIQMQNSTTMRFGVVAGTTTVGVVNQNGGNVTFYSDAGATVGGTGFLNMQQAGSGSHTYNLNGGTLTVPRIDSVANGGARVFNFNGGALRATQNEANFMLFNTNGGAGSNRANIRNGGAIIDTNGFNVGIPRPLDHSNIGGDNAIDGGLTKIGAGTLTLSGTNTYTGPTNVNAGTLALSHASNNNIASSQAINLASGTTLNVNSLAGSTLALASGQTLAGTGTLQGNLIVGLGSTIAPGASPGTMFQVGDQTWNDGGTFNFEIDDAGGTAGGDPGWSLLDITGELDLSGLSAGGFTIDIDSLLHPSHSAGELQVDAVTEYTWDFVHTTSGVVDFSSDLFAFNTDDFTSNFGGSFSIQQNGNNLELVFTSIPEPSAYAIWTLVGLAVGGFACRRIRRKK